MDYGGCLAAATCDPNTALLYERYRSLRCYAHRYGAASVRGGATLAAYTVPLDHPVIGYRIDHVQWPTDTVLTAILRDGVPVAPSADVVIEGGDELFFITTLDGEDQIRALFA